LKVDESTLTGESKLIAKRPGDVVLSGKSTIQGSGKMIVIAVGSNSVSCKIRACVNKSKESEDDDLEGDHVISPLFVKMDTNAKIIGSIGTVSAIYAFAATTVTAECCRRFVISVYIIVVQTKVKKPFIPFWLCSDSAIDAVASFLFLLNILGM